MNFFTTVFRRLWNLSPNWINRMVQRSSSNFFVQVPQSLSAEELAAESNRWPLWRLLLYAYLGVTVLRFWATAAVMSTGTYEHFHSYDVIMRLYVDTKIMTVSAGILMSPLTVFIIHFDYTVFLKRFNSVPRLAHELIVVNPKDFFLLNPHLKLEKLSFRNSVEVLKQSCSTFRFLYSPKSGNRQPYSHPIKWAVPVLPFFPHISETTRTRALLLTWLFQLAISVFLAGTVCIILIGGHYYHLYFLLRHVPFLSLKYFIGLAEITTICLTTFHTISMVLFLLHIFLIVQYVYHCFMLQMKSALFWTLILKVDHSSSKPDILFELKFTRLVNFITEETVLGLKRATSADRLLASPLLFYGSVSHFPLNIYLICSVHFMPLSAGDRVVVYCLLGMQALFAFGALQAMLKLSGDLQTPGKWLGLAQLRYNTGGCYRWRFPFYLRTKLKMMIFYEALHSQSGFSFTFGPLGKVTSKSVYEFIFIYSACLLFIFNLVRKQLKEEENELTK